MPKKSKSSKAKKSPSSKAPKYVYSFGNGKADGNGKMKSLLGGKGANLAEMTRIRLPVPAGFTISTEVCTYFYDHKRTYPLLSISRLMKRFIKWKSPWGKSLAT